MSLRWAEEHLKEELGGEYIIFESEFVPVMPGLADIMEYNDLRPRKKARAARCKCTNCGEDFVTQWVSGGGFRVIEGEDGEIYTTDPGYTYDRTDGTSAEGNRINCPYCEEEAAVLRAKQPSRRKDKAGPGGGGSDSRSLYSPDLLDGAEAL